MCEIFPILSEGRHLLYVLRLGVLWIREYYKSTLISHP